MEPKARLPVEPRSPLQMNTVLLPRESVVLESISQYRMPFGPSNWVGQHPIEPDIVSERHQPNARKRKGPQRVALRRMTPEEEKGIPFEQQFRIVSDSGEELATRSVRILECRYDEKHYDAALRQVPAEAIVNGSVWCVFVHFDGPEEASDRAPLITGR
ncbi:MAG TPA: hypothetical protein VGM50_20330 [Gemmatimonadaceae bacterium]